MDKATEKTKKNKKKKPLRRAKHWGTQVLPMAGRLAVLLIAIVVLGLMFSALQGVGSAWLRVALSGAWSETESVSCRFSSASASMPGTTPQVESEMWRIPMFSPSG